jgi:hypothetical protein
MRAFLVLFCTHKPTNLKKTASLLPLICIVQLFCSTNKLSAQSDDERKELPLIGLGAGLTYFHGDVGHDNSTGGAFRTGFRFGVEQRFLHTLGAEVYGVYGTLTANEHSSTFNRNFTTKFMSIGGGLMLDLDNDFLLSRRATVGPYIGAGFMWMNFDPHGDLRDSHDSLYHYWSDGSIRTVAETSPNALNAGYLSRDYTYETKLTDSTTNYSRSTFGIPLSVGSKFKFSRHAGADFRFTYNLTFSDYIDNEKFDRADGWAYMSVSLYYQFNKPEQKEKGTSGSDILNEDSDKDGVRDADDLCAGTPAGVKVNRNGCPPDTDEDGVPDYKDKEPNTPKNTPVNAEGVTTRITQTDSLGNVINPDCIPEKYRAADVDGNCKITADEINSVIDNFFDGEGNWTADSINGLIDYFFEQ